MIKADKHYNSPRAFSDAFQSKFRGEEDRQTIIVMQRFSARVCQVVEGAVVKGGLGLELRLDTPRTTKDADLIISGSDKLEARLNQAGELDLGDFLRYTVTPEPRGSEINAPGMLYPGKRYKVQARFASGPGPWAGKIFRKFSAEISIRSPSGHDTIDSEINGFPQASIAPIRVYSLHWQIAEKVHAYTDPRHRDASDANLMRPRDLLDMCRCAISSTPYSRLEAEALRTALEQTFQQRKQAAQEQQVILQDLPKSLPAMPEAWTEAFEKGLKHLSLPWRTPADAHRLAAQFLDPVLSGTAIGTWDPARKLWVEPARMVKSAPTEETKVAEDAPIEEPAT